jgi:xanthine dehydrogenase molybdopterin-binding subunit B
MEINGLIGTAVDENRYPGVGFQIFKLAGRFGCYEEKMLQILGGIKCNQAGIGLSRTMGRQDSEILRFKQFPESLVYGLRFIHKNRLHCVNNNYWQRCIFKTDHSQPVEKSSGLLKEAVRH